MIVKAVPTLSELSTSIEAGLTLKTDEYYTGYEVDIDNVNPLASIDPLDHDKFFGPQVLNIILISQPFGWTFDGANNNFEWPPEGFDESLARIREAYPKWNEFKVYMYGDKSLASQLDESELMDMLSQTFTNLETFCTDNADIGFVWGGILETLPDQSFFRTIIDTHYGHST